jgi:hypothetical protein
MQLASRQAVYFMAAGLCTYFEEDTKDLEPWTSTWTWSWTWTVFIDFAFSPKAVQDQVQVEVQVQVNPIGCQIELLYLSEGSFRRDSKTRSL